MQKSNENSNNNVGGFKKKGRGHSIENETTNVFAKDDSKTHKYSHHKPIQKKQTHTEPLYRPKSANVNETDSYNKHNTNNTQQQKQEQQYMEPTYATTSNHNTQQSWKPKHTSTNTNTTTAAAPTAATTTHHLNYQPKSINNNKHIENRNKDTHRDKEKENIKKYQKTSNSANYSRWKPKSG